MDFKSSTKNKKFIETVALINNKKIIKSVFLNLDMITFAFGFIPSILRKRYETAVGILTLQILNFFLISFPYSLLTNLIITGVASIITARVYLNQLFDEEKFIPYAMWKDMNEEDEKIEKQLILSNKKMERTIIISTIFIVITLIFSLFCTYIKLTNGTEYKKNTEVIEDTAVINKSEMSINNYAIIATEEDAIHSVLILNSNENKELEGIIYPGKLQVQLYDTVDELCKLVDVNNKEALIEAFKTSFNIEIGDFGVINKADDKEDIIFYEDILSKLLGVHENDLDNKIRNLKEKYSDIDEEKLREFYNSFRDKNVNISNLKYDTVVLGDVVELEVLETLDLLDRINYEFITLDKSILQNNKEVKSIYEEYDEYIKAKNEESLKEEALNQEVNTETTTPTTPTPPSDSGQSNNTKPPVNNEQSGSTTPPVNNGQTGGEIKPPVENTTPPSNTEGDEGAVNPPVDSENLEGNINN